MKYFCNRGFADLSSSLEESEDDEDEEDEDDDSVDLWLCSSTLPNIDNPFREGEGGGVVGWWLLYS